ncbi:MAG: hypothetical protein HY296_08400 [Thaumarchaeota archaeon]|nr:hypothetical protein [Nitrososphaerota archaeon]
MPKTNLAQKFVNEPQDIEAKIVRAIGSVGPRNIALLSRMTGAHQETVRYKVKKRFGKLGFRFQAEVDYAKLGLQLHLGTFRFSRAYESSAPKFFRALNRSGYLTHFSKVIPQGYYVAIFTLPPGVVKAHLTTLRNFQRQGLLTWFRLEEIATERHRQMDPAFFNFRSGTWEVEWNRLNEQAGSPLPVGGSKPVKFDYVDLLIVKELQIDAMEHVVQMGKKLKVHSKRLEYHYRTHVLKQKLVPQYRVRWMQDIGKTLAHSVAFTRMTFRGLGPDEFARTQKALSKIPFLWAEDVLKDGTYIATINIPLADLVATNSFLNRAAPGLGSKVEIGYLNPTESSNFTIPYDQFKDGAWTFDPKKVESEALDAVHAVEK